MHPAIWKCQHACAGLPTHVLLLIAFVKLQGSAMVSEGQITFSQMDNVIWGKPAAEALAAEIEANDARRVFLIVSGTLNRTTDEIEKIRNVLGKKCVGEFSEMPPHTPRAAVIKASDMIRESNADLIVTLGGGSVTDGAKAIALCLANNITQPDDIDTLLPGQPPAVSPTVRQITIPTTLSGGEFSALSGVTNEKTARKDILRHPGIIPKTVILDPAVTVHTPEWLWLSTGIRAVDHCVEGICSNESNPYADAQALKGLTLLANGLPRVKAKPDDLEARMNCQLGTWLSMGPLASGVPMGASHGIGYVLGAVFDIPHGYTSCVMLPAVMKWNQSVNASKQALVSDAMGRPGEDPSVVLHEFIAGLGLPRTLASVDVTSDDFGKVAEQAMATPWVPRNPRAIAGPEEVREILDLAS